MRLIYVLLLIFMLKSYIYSQDKLIIKSGSAYDLRFIPSSLNILDKQSMIPSLSLMVGVKGFFVSSKLGAVSHFGFNFGGDRFLFGVHYVYSAFSTKEIEHSFMISANYVLYESSSKSICLMIGTSHGFTFDSNLYVFSPIRFSLNYSLFQQ